MMLMPIFGHVCMCHAIPAIKPGFPTDRDLWRGLVDNGGEPFQGVTVQGETDTTIVIRGIRIIALRIVKVLECGVHLQKGQTVLWLGWGIGRCDCERCDYFVSVT